jgi:prefoldin subunit 5
MSSITYNDMPGELKDKIKLWELLNRILRTNGFVDLDTITNDLANLKTQLNSLLSEVLGVEHEIDTIHNYDDASIKNDVANIKAQLQTATNNISALQGKINGITSSPTELDIKNDAAIDLSTMDGNNIGTRIVMTRNQVAVQ